MRLAFPDSSRFAFSILASALLAGCAGTPIPEERAAQRQATQVGQIYRRTDASAQIPALSVTSTADDYIRFALFKHPQVEAAYDEWLASVDAITPARSLPDPQLTAQPDVTSGNTLAIMPGVMFDFMTRGKRAAMGREAAAGAEVAYRGYASVVLRTAVDVRKAWIELAYVDEALRLQQESQSAIEQSLNVTNADYATGSGMVSFEGQVRLLNQAAELKAKVGALEARRDAARSRFKAALGLLPDDPNPPWPRFVLTMTPLPPEGELWKSAVHANPDLASMRATVDMAIASIGVARATRTPDFGAGLMYDNMASPVPVRPNAYVTLPIWKDKIAAVVAGAEMKRDAATARVRAEQINLAAEIAQMLYMVRESDLMIRTIDETELPNLERSIASSEAAYESGAGGAAMIPETNVMALGMRLSRIEALRQRETAVTDLLLEMAGVAPSGAPLLAESAQTP